MRSDLPVLLLVVVGLATAWPSREVSGQGQALPTDEPKVIYESTDDALDDARTAPRGGTQLVDGVLAQLESAVTKHPDSALLQTAMGRALIIRDCAMMGNNCSVRAKGHLTKAIGLDPKLIRAHVLLAHDAMNSGCLQCALPHIRAAQPLEPNNPYLLEVLGRYSQLFGNEVDAEKRYLKAIEEFPTPKKRWQTYTWLAEIYKERSDYARAEDVLVKARDAAPEGAWPNGNLGTFYIFTAGDYDKAIPALRKTLSIMSYGYARQGLALSLYERWANAYLKKSRPSTLKIYWEEAQEESPDAQTMFFVSAMYHGTGRAARALLDTKRVPRSVLDQPWDQGRTVLQMAAQNDNTDLCVYLIERGANPDAHDRYGIYVAHSAGAWGNTKVLEALARKNANLKVATREARETVLMLVAKAGELRPGNTKAAALLIGKGVPVNAKSAQGWTALGYAIGARDIEMVRYLLARKAKVNDEFADGITPASYAILMGNIEILQALMSKNLDLNAKVSGMSLAEFAEKNGKPEMAEMLRSHR